MSAIALPVGYGDWLERKSKRFVARGLEASDISPMLYDFQAATVKWALNKGRACIFAGTGLGKTLMQCEWARQVPGKRLILAPLAVGPQTIREAQKIGLDIRRVSDASGVDGDGVYLSNYQRLHLLSDVNWDGVVLDESSILKSHDGAYRQFITDAFARVPYKLACTATPAPNDYMELGTHAEFVGASTRMEMLATYFMHDGGDTALWRLKRHARKDFWKWVASWAACYFSPSDVGFDASRFELPELIIHEHSVDSVFSGSTSLFGDASNATNLHKVLKESAPDRIAEVMEIVTAHLGEPWIIWCNSNTEQDLIERALPGIASVRGDDSDAVKEDRLIGFAEGRYRVLVTKPSIAGFGMNWQHCNRVVFAGLTYSFEQFYQAVRRCWRFGQTRPVHCHIVTADSESHVRASLAFKSGLFSSMADDMRQHSRAELMEVR